MRTQAMLASTLLTATILLSGCGGTTPSGGSSGPSKTVDMPAATLTYEPDKLTVANGTTVKWINRGTTVHTVTADDGSFDSGNMAAGKTFEWKFTQPGTYSYFCKPHKGAGMVGTVTVT